MSGASGGVDNVDSVELCKFACKCVGVSLQVSLCVIVCVMCGFCDAISVVPDERPGKESSQESQVCSTGWKRTIW